MDRKISPDDLETQEFVAGDLPVASAKKASQKKTSGIAAKNDILSMNSGEISQFLVNQLGKFKKDLTSQDLETLKPHVLSLAAPEKDNKNLFDCLQKQMPDWKKELKRPLKKVRVIIVCSSAKKAVELIRQLNPLKNEVGVGKCFAKHFKISDQLAFFEQKRPAVLVGTPNRIEKLLQSEKEYFDLSELELFMIESVKDAKQRNILEIPETATDLLNIYVERLCPILKSQKTRLVFF